MPNKDRINNIIQKIHDITENTQNPAAKSAADDLRRQADSFEIKAVLLGQFSAGKSSLINELIGRTDFLEEGICPTTELAAELHYTDSKEYYEAVMLDGKTVTIDDPKEIDRDKTACLKYHIDSVQLAKLGEYTVVDTPGINSGIEKHNKAIANYLTNGSVFIFVVPAENGGFSKYDLSLLREISNYSSRIAVIISKCDKLTEDDVNAVREKILEELDFQFIDALVYCVSRNDQNISDKLISIISSFDTQKIYDEKMKELVISEASIAIGAVNAELTGMYLSTYSQDRDISSYTMKRKLAVREFDRKRGEIEEEVVIKGTEQVMNSIGNALESNIGRMADAVVLGSREGLEACVSECVRPAIISAVGEIGQDITLGISNNLGYTENFFKLPDKNGGRDALDIIGDAVQKLPIPSGKDTLPSGGLTEGIDLPDDNDKSKRKSDNNMTYKLITSAIGMVSGGSLSWLELVVVVLPEIIDLLKLAFGESKTDKAKKQLRSVIFPQIREKLYPKVHDCILKKAEQYTAALETSYGQQLELIDSKLEECRQLIATNKAAFTEKRDALEDSVNELYNIIRELEGQ